MINYIGGGGVKTFPQPKTPNWTTTGVGVILNRHSQPNTTKHYAAEGGFGGSYFNAQYSSYASFNSGIHTPSVLKFLAEPLMPENYGDYADLSAYDAMAKHTVTTSSSE